MIARVAALAVLTACGAAAPAEVPSHRSDPRAPVLAGVDRDDDGVDDAIDRCVSAPEDVDLHDDADGCPDHDDDRDGVPDLVDHCFDTPGIAEGGCPIVDDQGRQLAAVMPEGSTVEIQWTMSPEKPVEQGGEPGDRGHIQGDELSDALNNHTQRSFNAMSPGVVESDYTIDAATRATADPDTVGKYVPPVPEKRLVITFGPKDEQTRRPTGGNHDE